MKAEQPEPALPEAAPSGDEPTPSRSPGRVLDPLSSWRRHRRRIPVVVASILMLGFPLAWKMGVPGWYTEAALRVSPSYVANLDEQADVQLASNTQYLVFVQQQVATIRSYDVAIESLRELGDRRTLWQKPDETERRAAERLMAALQVKAVRDTYLITIGLAGDAPEGLADIVNTVAAVYTRGSRDEGLFAADTRVRNLEDRRDQIRQEMDGQVARLTGLAAELGVSTFEDTALNPFDSRIVATGQALADWRRRRVAAEAKVDALAEAHRREAAIELDAAARDRIERAPAVASATKLYWDRRDALLAQAQGLSSSHPGYAPIQKQLADLDAELRRVVDHEKEAAVQLLREQRDAQAESEMSRARMELDEARRVEDQLAREQKEQQDALSTYTSKYQDAIDLTGDLRRSRKRVDAIGNRIDSFQLEAVAPGFLRVVADARVPEFPSEGGRRKLFAMVVLLALGAGLVAPVLLDRLDPRVVLPGDVEKALGIAPMAWIVERMDDRSAAIARDQVRRLALRLAREGDAGQRHVLLTGVRAGSGSSTLALELGAELTRIGVRTVVVESDPEAGDARYAGAACSLADVIRDGADLDDAIVAGSASRPDRIAMGEARDSLLLSHRGVFAGVFSSLAGRYDCVLLDAPPLTAAAETEMLVSFAGTSLLVVPANAVSPRDVTAAALALEKAAPTSVGIVMNRVREHQHVRALAACLPSDGEAERRNPEIAVQRWLWN